MKLNAEHAENKELLLEDIRSILVSNPDGVPRSQICCCLRHSKTYVTVASPLERTWIIPTWFEDEDLDDLLLDLGTICTRKGNARIYTLETSE